MKLARIDLRCTQDQKEAVARKAALAGLTVSAWILRQCRVQGGTSPIKSAVASARTAR